MTPSRGAPNVLVTGTPGTGKTTTCELICQATGLRHINIGDLVKEQELHSGWDEEFDCLVIDEDKVPCSAVGGDWVCFFYQARDIRVHGGQKLHM